GPESELPIADHYAARLADLEAARTALEVLRDAPPLRAGSSFALRAALAPDERAALCAMRDPLAGELAGLATSQRTDWGAAFLLGAARLVALEESCAGGSWVVLDAFAGGSWPEVPAPRSAALAALLADAEDALVAARARVAALPGTRTLSAVEDL